MKLILKSTDINYLHSLKGLLEANGIPAVVSGDSTARILTPFATTEPSLWVYIDVQFHEATELTNNPEYDVKNRVDVNEFYELNNEIMTQPKSLNGALIHLGIVSGLIILALFLLASILKWMATT